jgi:hypothetical protein
MREDHCLYQTEPRCKTGRQQCGHSRKDICSEENRAKRARIDTKPKAEPVGRETLRHKATRERVEGEQAGEPEDNVTGAAKAKGILFQPARQVFSS